MRKGNHGGIALTVSVCSSLISGWGGAPVPARYHCDQGRGRGGQVRKGNHGGQVRKGNHGGIALTERWDVGGGVFIAAIAKI
ncbi:MAG: hypothetical protein VKJ64_07170 [Leptolyngbyaceae bacterium]|nr:hypothetical protein [Leptolyngbyaceae bacterium]